MRKIITNFYFSVLLILSLAISNVNAQSSLCASAGGDQTYEWATRISINGQTFTSGKTGYSDFTGSLMTTLTAGQTYPIEFDVNVAAGPLESPPFTEWVIFWMDLNQDGAIDNATERVFEQSQSVSSILTYSGTITIPSSGFNGTMDCRMIMQYNSSPNLCGTYQYGTTYDVRLGIVGGQTNPVNNTLTVAKAGAGSGDVVSTPAGINTALGIYSYDFLENTVITLTETPASGSTFYAWTGDATGTSTTTEVTLSANKSVTAHFDLEADITPPEITAFNISAYLDATGNVTVTAADIGLIVTDNVDPNPTNTWTNKSYNCSNIGVNWYSVSATDASNNTSGVEGTITVNDNTAPVAPTLADVTSQCAVASITAPTATDVCAGTITGTTATLFPISAQGTTVVTWYFIDGNGNIVTATQNVIVDDNEVPSPDAVTNSNLTITINGSWLDEISWNIKDKDNNVVISRTTGSQVLNFPSVNGPFYFTGETQGPMNDNKHNS